nr:PREDICTED: retinitis pigmentosa 1-like 1 protein [Lepisosteus oculatus]XP_015207760.1 PREDICTED: retinitis pigmentosa 1-like 1 protein [Lepisosteus oculatus]
MQRATLGYPDPILPFNNDLPLPPVNRNSTNVTVSSPAKKITFYKSGDPQFGGIRMAIHKRSFKCFDALLDDLSQKVPLPFGVRTITTPRGTRCINHLDQLEDGGCYLCSDRRQVKPINIEGPGRKPTLWQGSHLHHTRRRLSHLDDGPGSQTSQHFHRHPRRIVLVKNNDPAVRRSIILSRRTARSLKVFIDEISELMQCTIRKLYTLDGRKIDTIQGLMQCPNVLVCVGREPFRPLLVESLRKNSEEKLPGLGARSRSSFCSDTHESKKNVNFGLETKKSIIHPRSDSSNRSMRFSLSSEKSFPNGLNMSPGNTGCPSHAGTCPHVKEAMMDDDIQKRVLVNKDGSLSVEMKVRFRLLNDEMLQWSTEIKKTVATNNDCSLEKEDELGPIQQSNSETCSEGESLCPCEAEDSYISKLRQRQLEESHCQNCCNHCQEYDIWKNPMHSVHCAREAKRAVRHIRSSSSSASSHRIICKKASMDSLVTMSSEEYREQVVEQSSCFTHTVEEGDTRVEYCTISRCCSRSELCSKASVSKSTETPAHIQEGKYEDIEIVHVCSDNEQKRPGSAISASSKSSVQDKVGVKITKVFEEDERPQSSISNSSRALEVLKEDQDEKDEDRAGSTASRASSLSQNGKRNKREELENEERPTSITSNYSGNSCHNSISPMHHLSPRPVSKASSCSSLSCRLTKNINQAVDDDDECAPSPMSTSTKASGNSLRNSNKTDCIVSNRTTSAASSLSELPTGKEVVEVAEESEISVVSAMSASITSSRKSRKSKKCQCSASERASTPGSMISENPDMEATEEKDERAVSPMSTSTKASAKSRKSKGSIEECDERAVSAISLSTRASGKSNKSHKSHCSTSERPSTPGSSVSEAAASKEVDQTAEDSNERVASEMSASTKTSRKSKMTSQVECSASGRATTLGSSVSATAVGNEAEQAIEENEGRPASAISLVTRASGQSDTSKNNLCRIDERGPSPTSSISDMLVGKDTEQREEDEERARSAMSLSTKASGHSRRSQNTNCSPSERVITPASSMSEKRTGSETEQVAEERVESAFSTSTKASSKSKACSNLGGASDRVPSSMSKSSSSSARKNKETLCTADDDHRSPSKASNFSLSSCEKDIGNEDCDHQEADHSYSEPCYASEAKEAVAIEPDEDERPSSSGSKSHSKDSKNRKASHDRLSTASSRSVFSTSSHSAKAKPKVQDHNAAEKDQRPRSNVSSVSSYLHVKGSNFKSNTKSDDESTVMPKSTRPSKKGSKKHVEIEEISSPISGPISVSSQSFHSPTPPKGKPHKNMRPVILLGSSKGSTKTESISATESLKENNGNIRPATVESKSNISDKIFSGALEVAECSKNASDNIGDNGSRCKNRKRCIVSQQQKEEPSVPELMPSCLPNATPAEVVHEWLRKIPLDTSMYEVGEEFHENCDELEIKQKQSEKMVEPALEVEVLAAEEGKPEEEESSKEEQKDVSETNHALKKEEQEEPQQANTEEQVASSVPTDTNKEAFLKSCHSSVQVMKVLLNPSQGTKLDRCNSLPEVSPVYGRKLSNSAKELLDCLSSLQLIDTEPLDANAKSTRYKELMNILQSLWLGGACDEGQQVKLTRKFKDHHSTDDEFNPRSSSGVDVSCGSAGSGKSSVTGVVDVVQSERKAELTSKQINMEDRITPTHTFKRHDSLALLEENEANADEQNSGLSTHKPRLTAKTPAALSNPATPDIASRVRWSHENEGIGSDEEDERQSHEEDKEKMNNGQISDITKKESNSTSKTSENECSNLTSHEETETNTQEEEAFTKDEERLRSAVTSPNQNRPQTPHRHSQDPDPVWVLNLLKKVEKQFMAHYINAMTEFKVRWNLDDNDQLDAMINELGDEVRKRIQSSIDRELKKIQSRVGKLPRPPQNSMKRESTVQTEQRRRRLKVMHNKSIDGSLQRSEDNYTYSGTEFSEQRSEDEYCPCDTCMKKKMASRPVQPVVIANAPLIKDFDLRKILQTKREFPKVQEQNEAEKEVSANSGQQHEFDRDENHDAEEEKESIEGKHEDGEKTQTDDEYNEGKKENIDTVDEEILEGSNIAEAEGVTQAPQEKNEVADREDVTEQPVEENNSQEESDKVTEDKMDVEEREEMQDENCETGENDEKGTDHEEGNSTESLEPEENHTETKASEEDEKSVNNDNEKEDVAEERQVTKEDSEEFPKDEEGEATENQEMERIMEGDDLNEKEKTGLEENEKDGEAQKDDQGEEKKQEEDNSIAEKDGMEVTEEQAENDTWAEEENDNIDIDGQNEERVITDINETEGSGEEESKEAAPDEDQEVDLEDSDDTEVQNETNAENEESAESKAQKEGIDTFEQEQKRNRKQLFKKIILLQAFLRKSGTKVADTQEGDTAGTVKLDDCDQKGNEKNVSVQNKGSEEDSEGNEIESETDIIEKMAAVETKDQHCSAHEETEDENKEGELESNEEKNLTDQKLSNSNESLCKQISKSSIESLQGSMEKSMDKELEKKVKDANSPTGSSGSLGAKCTQMYPESSTEDEDKESDCSGPEGDTKDIYSAGEEEKRTVIKSACKNAKVGISKEFEQDDFDF